MSEMNRQEFVHGDKQYLITWSIHDNALTENFHDYLYRFRNLSSEDEDSFWSDLGYFVTVEEEMPPDLYLVTWKPTDDSICESENTYLFEIHRHSTGKSEYFQNNTEDGSLDADAVWRAAYEMTHKHGINLENCDCTINGVDYRWSRGESPIKSFNTHQMTFRDILKALEEMSDTELDKVAEISISEVTHYALRIEPRGNEMNCLICEPLND